MCQVEAHKWWAEHDRLLIKDVVEFKDTSAALADVDAAIAADRIAKNKKEAEKRKAEKARVLARIAQNKKEAEEKKAKKEGLVARMAQNKKEAKERRDKQTLGRVDAIIAEHEKKVNAEILQAFENSDDPDEVL
jgi:hypothetical protein